MLNAREGEREKEEREKRERERERERELIDIHLCASDQGLSELDLHLSGCHF